MHEGSRIHRDQGFRSRRAIAEGAVWADGVVVDAPLLDDDLGLADGVEDLAVEQFVPEPRVEALNVAVFPRRARLDVGGPGADRCDPVPDRGRDELGTVARREEGLPVGYGRARSPQIAQRVAITGSQVSTVVLLNHTAEETGYDRHPFYRADLAGRHRHFQASP